MAGVGPVSALAAAVAQCVGHFAWEEGEGGDRKIIWPRIPGCRCLLPVLERERRLAVLRARIEALDEIGRSIVLDRLLLRLGEDDIVSIGRTMDRMAERDNLSRAPGV